MWPQPVECVAIRSAAETHVLKPMKMLQVN